MIYKPAEDSFLLAHCVSGYSGKNALEIGVGSGIILDVLERHFENVIGTDIDFSAIHKRRKTNSVLVCCDAASALAPGNRFELIVSNPPYLPDDEKIVDRTVHGGPAGIETTVHFVETALPLLAESGRILIVVSSLADSAAFDDLVAREGLNKKVKEEKRLFYETLSVVELSK